MFIQGVPETNSQFDPAWYSEPLGVFIYLFNVNVNVNREILIKIKINYTSEIIF